MASSEPLFILLYFFGGIVKDTLYAFERLRIQKYDPDTDTWEIKADVSATSRNGFTVAGINGKIYVIGGNDAGTNEEYDPLTNIWTTRSDMPTPRNYLAAGVVNNKIYAIGGVTGGTGSAANEEYTPPATYYIYRKD